MTDQITARTLIDAGLSRAFAHFVVKGERNVSIPLAMWLLEERGLRVAPLAGMSPDQIETLKERYTATPPPGLRKKAHG